MGHEFSNCDVMIEYIKCLYICRGRSHSVSFGSIGMRLNQISPLSENFFKLFNEKIVN
jgi:hypothetical protein